MRITLSLWVSLKKKRRKNPRGGLKNSQANRDTEKHKEWSWESAREGEEQQERKTERWWRGKGEVEKAESALTFGGYVCISMGAVWGVVVIIYRWQRWGGQPGGQSVSQSWRQAWGWIYTLRSGNCNLTLGNRKRTIGSLRMEGKV